MAASRRKAGHQGCSCTSIRCRRLTPEQSTAGRARPEAPGEADTLAGFIFGKLGRVPDIGERLEINGLLMEVQQVVERQIRWVRMLRRSEFPAQLSAGEDA